VGLEIGPPAVTNGRFPFSPCPVSGHTFEPRRANDKLPRIPLVLVRRRDAEIGAAIIEGVVVDVIAMSLIPWQKAKEKAVKVTRPAAGHARHDIESTQVRTP
jgi:hypothetical protein